jgi:hypothetical protein
MRIAFSHSLTDVGSLAVAKFVPDMGEDLSILVGEDKRPSVRE